MQAVLDFRVDIGFIEGPCHSTEIISEPWLEDELVVFAAPTSPLARGPVTLEPVSYTHLVRPLWVCKLWFYRCCRWSVFGYYAKTRAGNRPAWFTGAGGGDAFQPDERDHCRVLYWFSLSFIAGCTPY